MKYSAAVLVAAAVSGVNADVNAFEEGGNWFAGLNPVKQIKYGGLDIPGAYRAVSQMLADGTCTYTTKQYSGPIAPYDEQLSIHLRGPAVLLEAAIYLPGTGSSKRDVTKAHSKRHGHSHLHKKADIVKAVIDGKEVSWVNNWFGPNGSPPAAAPPAAAPAAVPNVAPVKAAAAPVSAAADAGTISGAGSTDSVPIGSYKRVGYYNQAQKVANGITFLANKGDPSLSGTWDTTWGNSLSYVASDGVTCSAGPAVFGGSLGDGDEIAIYSDQECDASCGTVRPGSVAYKGWAGADKVFLFEFMMPNTGTTGWNKNMPALWALNAAIARTGQYTSCSCWKGDNSSPQAGGCGEADLFEILATGDMKAKSTFHFANGLGDSHYFERPTDKPIKIAAVFQSSSSTATIRVLDDDFDFSDSLTGAQISAMIADESDLNLFSFMTFGQ